MKTPLFYNGPSSAISTTLDSFVPLGGAGPVIPSNTQGATARAAGRVPIAGRIRRLLVEFPTTITTGSYEIRLLTGSSPSSLSDTGLVVTVTAGTQTAQNLVVEVPVSAGQFAVTRIRPIGTPTAQANSIQISYLFDADVEGESLFWSYVGSGSTFGPLVTGGLTTSENIATVVFPCGGTISDMWAGHNAAPGTGNSRIFTARKGSGYGALSDTAMAATISGTATHALGSGSVSVSEGDFFSVAITTTGTPAAQAAVMTAKFVPSVPGEVPVFALATATLSATANRFLALHGATGAAETNGNNTRNLLPADVTFKRMRVATLTAQGSGRTRAFTLRDNGVDTALAVTLADATSGTATTDVVGTTGDGFNYMTVPSGSPTASAAVSVSAVLIVSDVADETVFLPTDRDGQVFEGIRNTGANQRTIVKGLYGGDKTDIQVALYDAPSGGSIVKDWTSASVQTGGAYRHTFTDVPAGGPYYQAVRDGVAGAVTRSTAGIKVGANVVLWGQSQCERLFTQDIASPSVSAEVNATILSAIDPANVTRGNRVDPLSPGMGQITRVTGSGAIAIANQWLADVGSSIPLQIVQVAYQGTGIHQWIANDPGTPGDATNLWGTSPSTGLAWAMADLAEYQATAVIFFQGTSNVGAVAAYPAQMDTLKGMFETLYNGTVAPPLFLVAPHPRSNDGNQVFALRNAQFAKASSGGTWRVLCSMLDHEMDASGSAHQANGATGQIRLGRRLGRGAAKWIIDNALDNLGPRILRAEFTDGSRNVIEITFDRDIKLADGTAFAGSPVALPASFSTSTNSGSTFTPLLSPDHSAAIVGARKVRLTKTTGSWPEGTTRIDYLRGTPYSSDPTTADFVGTEGAIQTDYLSKVITDTTSFDGGRGMPFAPPMGAGFAVAEAGAPTVYGPITLSATDQDGTTVSLPPSTITVSG